jgi:hypothetical protein
LPGVRGRYDDFDARGRDGGRVERLVADQHRDAMTRHGDGGLERRYRGVRPGCIGLRALDVERRGESRALARRHEAQRFVVRGRYRAHRVELAQRAREREVAGRDVRNDEKANAPRHGLRRARVGGGRRSARAQTTCEVDFPRDAEAGLPALGVGCFRNDLLGR